MGSNPQILVVGLDNYRSKTLQSITKQHQLLIKRFEDLGHQANDLSFLLKSSFQHFIFDIDSLATSSIDYWKVCRWLRTGRLKSAEDTPISFISSQALNPEVLVFCKRYGVNQIIDWKSLTTQQDVLTPHHFKRSDKHCIAVLSNNTRTHKKLGKLLSAHFEIICPPDIPSLLNESGQSYDLLLLDSQLCSEPFSEQWLTFNESTPHIVITTDIKQTSAQWLSQGAFDWISIERINTDLVKLCFEAIYQGSSQQISPPGGKSIMQSGAVRAIDTLASLEDAIITTDSLGRVEYINPVAEKLTGWQAAEAIHKPINEIIQTFNRITMTPIENPVEACLNPEQSIHAQKNILLRNRYARDMVVQQSSTAIKDKDNKISGAVMVFRDNTETNRLQEQLSYQANHDNLTGLHNRDIFNRQLISLTENINRDTSKHCLLHIDISQFQMINDSCGHYAGDILLQRLAPIIQSHVRDRSDSVARLGGDKFAVLLRDCPINAAQRIATNILRSICGYEFNWQDKNYQIGCSIGAAEIDAGSNDSQQALGAAETACNIAKDHGRNCVQIYHRDDHEITQRQSEKLLISELLNAEKEDRFLLYCQEMLPLQKNAPSSYEVLLRLKNSNGDLLLPGQFLAAAERYNLMRQIDRWVVRNSLKFFADNPEFLQHVEHVAINLSALSIGDDDCYAFISDQFNEFNVSPGKICFEITETTAVANMVRAIEFINAIRNLGCKFALDDFGSGMSSFAYLKQLPVDYLKIDGMFVKGLQNDKIDFEMVRSINGVGQALKLQTVAEFVGDGETMGILKGLGVDYAQGFYISKPQAIEDLLVSLRS